MVGVGLGVGFGGCGFGGYKSWIGWWFWVASEVEWKLSFLVFLLCVLISLKKQNAETKKGSRAVSWSLYDAPSIFADPSPSWPMFLSTKLEKKVEEADNLGSLRYDYHNESCPQTEQIIRTTVQELYKLRSNVSAALLRLVFHDCFLEGCDASVLPDAVNGIDNETIASFASRGFSEERQLLSLVPTALE
ncbi:unnamed protein product [Ilex paraguariensis]|uniref:peroxidase n=1 Tax=Ilex paraguariensis TaxID=185542 RepID=A0ABC8U366_9AQUA